jgi:hypothetical protein
VAGRELDRDARDELERAHAIAAGAAQCRQQLDRRGGIAHGSERRRPRTQRGIELHAGGRDHAERAFRAEEQGLDVVAGIVLAQTGEGFEHATVGQHHFESEHELARHAVPDHVETARVRREISTQQAAAFRPERQRQVAIGLGRHGLQLREDAPRLGGQRVVSSIDGAHAIEARQRQKHLAARGVRRRAAAIARIAALGHDSDPVPVAEGEHARDRRGVRGRDDREGVPVVLRAVVAEHGRRAGRVGEEPGLVDQVAQVPCQGSRVEHGAIVSRQPGGRMAANNPYAPPKAAVDDVSSDAVGYDPNPVSLMRPAEVRRSVQLLWIAMALGFVLALIDVLNVDDENPDFWWGLGAAVGTSAVMFAVFFWIYGAVYAGRNWARIVVLVLTVVWTIMLLAIVVMLGWGSHLSASTKFDLLFNAGQFALTLVATVLLFTPAANAWYRAIKAAD